MRLNYDDEDKVEVQMSPLIDCVFLLLPRDYHDEEMGNANPIVASFDDVQPFYYTCGRRGCYHCGR